MTSPFFEVEIFASEIEFDSTGAVALRGGSRRFDGEESSSNEIASVFRAALAEISDGIRGALKAVSAYMSDTRILPSILIGSERDDTEAEFENQSLVMSPIDQDIKGLASFLRLGGKSEGLDDLL